MSAWTPEPWIVGSGTRIYMGGAVEAREIAVATKADPSERVKAPANAQRIVACVNGCAELEPAAYRECVEALRSIKAYCDSLPDEQPIMISLEVWGKVDQALAHAEGRQVGG